MGTETTDLGLSLQEAEAGLKTAGAYEHNFPPEHGMVYPAEHMKVQAIYLTLVQKGVFTEAEYEEVLRQLYNDELARRQELLGKEFR